MSYQIHLDTDSARESLYPVVRRAAAAALCHLHPQPGEVTILLTDAGNIHELNKQFANHDYPTDVLSFADGSIDPGTEMVYFGDIVIAVDIAAAQADHAGHALEAELALLSVHGILHLLGFDHGSDEGKQAMWAKQAVILEELSYSSAIPKDDA
ncbi:MAG: rRNA maturation RNase YbeY [Anaerolineales bacterium]|nr:rRNA maturation RNase YbeY [Anaerolineales bacterium]